MQFIKKIKFSRIIYTTIMLQMLFSLNSQAALTKLEDIDTVRSELIYSQDRNSLKFTKIKEKIKQIVDENGIDYSNEARFKDIERLITQQKYDLAIFELNELIDENYQVSKCYEYLGDICTRTGKSSRTTARYYKLALEHDENNLSVYFKLSILYFNENKNLIGMEYLNQVIKRSDETTVLDEAEKVILNNIIAQNNYEGNILYEALGEIYLKQNKKDLTYQAYEKALEFNPNDIFIRYRLADLLFNNQKNKEAVIVYNSILKLNPTDAGIRASKAKSLAKLGDLDAAEEEYNTILIANPNSAEAKYGIYKIYEGKLAPDEILKKINKNIADYCPNQAELRSFAIFLKELNDSEGAKCFENCAQKLDELEKAQLSQQTRAKENKTEEKIFEAEKNVQLKQENISNADEKIILAQDESEVEAQPISDEEKEDIIKPLRKEKKQTESEEIAKKDESLEVSSPSPSYITPKKETAAEKVKPQTKKQPQSEIKKETNKKTEKEVIIEDVAPQRNTNIKKPEKYNEYKAQLDKYLVINPKDTQTCIAIANTYKLMNEPYNALKYYKRALKSEPANSDINYNIGLVYLELNSVQSAKTYLTKALNLDKNNTKALNLLNFVNQKLVTETINQAYSKFEQKEYIEAFEILDRGIEQYPQNAQLYYYRALVYDAMNRNAASIIDLQKAIELNPGYYMAYYQLGKLYEKIKDERSALVTYERFLSMEPDEKELIEEVQKKVLKLEAKYY